MSYAIGVTRRIRVSGTLPAGWRETGTAGGPAQVLALEGPSWVGDRRPRLVVTLEGEGAGGSAAAADVEIASHDRWPHPEWGAGVVRQGMRVADDVALAHDVYLFHDGRNGIRVELECELSSLFAVEEDVVRIIDMLSGGGSR